jgi:hypothetical protein
VRGCRLTVMSQTIAVIAKTHLKHDDQPAFVGHVEQVSPPLLLEEGPGWDSVDDAVEWGRARSSYVLVRTGATENDTYSAGVERVPRRWTQPGALYPEWSPEAR